MSNAVLDLAFEKHAQDYLCSESYDFLKEVECYLEYARETPAEEVFLQYRSIVDIYILAGSKLEININTAMRNKILEIGDRASFLAASDDRQRGVFNPARADITKMLDENLVHSFWTRPLFLESCKRWEEENATVTLAQGAEFDTSLALRAKVLSLYSLDTNTDAVIAEAYHHRCKFADPLVSTHGHREIKAQFRGLRAFLRQSRSDLISSHYDVLSRTLTMDTMMVFTPKLWPFGPFFLRVVGWILCRPAHHD
eukprot:g9020.t1